MNGSCSRVKCSPHAWISLFPASSVSSYLLICFHTFMSLLQLAPLWTLKLALMSFPSRTLTAFYCSVWQKSSWEDVQRFPSSFSPFSITVGPSTIMCSVKVTKKLHISKPRGQLSTFIFFHFSVIFDSDDGSTTLRHILHMSSPVTGIIYHLSLFSFLHILLKIYKSTSSKSISACIHLQNSYLYPSSIP